MFRYAIRALWFSLALALAAAGAWGQQTRGTLRGQVTDDTGGVIPGAKVSISGNGISRSLATNGDGTFVFSGLAGGTYTVRIAYPGFNPYESKTVEITSGRTLQLSVKMHLAAGKQEVTVQAEAAPQVSTEPDNNASSLVLRQEDLESLPDDPDDLAADLQALAGPSAGPDGGQIYIDGFTGSGRLPPKESIREIRINQNPFSAEYDHLGFGRIEILTKPGSDKFRGMAFFNFSDASMNSRNPLASNKPPFQAKLFGGNLSGPISKKSSFFLDFERRDIDDNAVVNGTILDSALNIIPFNQALVTPNRRTTISPRLDYQLTTNNTLTVRYSWSQVTQENNGIGQFTLASRAFNVDDTQHRLQATETAVLSPKMINETRFQFQRSNVNDIGDNSIPAINVLGAFSGGGAQIGNSYNIQNRYEVQNYSTITEHAHVVRFGIRVRSSVFDDYSPQNFGGTFTFPSIERYRTTLLDLQQGLDMTQIQALGAGPTQFTLSAGTPLASIRQTDIGAFVQDDWRVRQNLTLSLGLRYETQTNIHDWRDLAPRIGFAWAPGGRRRGRTAQTVVRGGFGMFYSRVDDSLSLQALRFNGVNQQQFIVSNPEFFSESQLPSTLPASLASSQVSQGIWKLSSTLRAPYITQSAIGIERQLPFKTTVASTFTYSHGVHLLLDRNINAPIPGTYTTDPAMGLRPYGNIGDLYQYESDGIYNQNQWMTNVTSRVNQNVTVFAFYVLNHARSNTDGANSSPANPYNIAAEYSRAMQDVRHRFVLGGSVVGPYGLRFSPFIMAHSGAPFNVTTGRDNNGDGVFNDRPAFATDPNAPGVVITPWGAFDPHPVAGETIISRNYLEGPGFVTVNLRLSRTFGFGRTSEGRGGSSDGGFHGGGGHHGGPGGGAMRMGPGGGMHGIFGGGGTNHRYNVTLSFMARNLLNNVNLGTPIGILTSPQFGQSNSLAGGFGPSGAANNRRLEAQLRFSF